MEAETCSQASGSSSGSSKGILKKDVNRDRSSPDKKRGITFPDYEELQEIIGYGGDIYYSSDDEDAKEPDVKPDTDYSEELSQEERNVLNITKKNTSFNSHPQNLKDPSSSPLPKLGVDKKHTPIISVRPFVREHTPGKVNMVSPMINGEIVTTRNNTKKEVPKLSQVESKILGSVKKLDKDDSGGRGEIKLIKKDNLGSDGSTENSSSSDSDSNTRDTPSPTVVKFMEFDLSTTGRVGDRQELSGDVYKKQHSFLGAQIEEQKAKSSAASVRLSLLNSSYTDSKSDDVDGGIKVKPNCMDESAPMLASNNAKLSLQNKSSSLSDIDSKKEENDKVELSRKVAASAAAARLSFLNSTIEKNNMVKQTEVKSDSHENDSVESVTVSGQISEDKRQHEQADNKNSEDKSQTAQEKADDSTKDSPKVKLTRKSPYVVGPFSSNSILKGTPKPVITRKPPILKDKPKVPLKPNKLMMRSPSSSPSPSPSPVVGTNDPLDNNIESTETVVDHVNKSSGVKSPAENNDQKPSPIAAPRKASFCQKSQYVNSKPAMGNETKLEETSSITVSRTGEKDSETIAKGHGRNNSLIISVSNVSTKTIASDPITITPTYSLNKTNSTSNANKKETTGPPTGANQSNKSETSPPQVQKNLATKNKEALEAIRKSLSNKLISGGPPQLVMESIKASEGGKSPGVGIRPVVGKTNSNSFEETRANIADALQFGRPAPALSGDSSLIKTTANKRTAPKPPDAETDSINTTLDENNDSCHKEVKDDPSSELSAEEVSNDSEVVAEPKLTPAIRNSSMKSEHSVKNKEPRTVQFSPETTTVTVPANTNAIPKVISYNSWLGKYQNHYLESSFTGNRGARVLS